MKSNKGIVIKKPCIKKIDNNKIKIYSEIKINNDIGKELYYEIESKEKINFDSEIADGFLVALLPLAMKKGYNIEVDAGISEKLYFQLTEFYIPIIARYQNDQQTIKIIAKYLYNNKINNCAVATGASGGVDSFYSICKYYNTEINGNKLTHLLFTNMCTLDNEENRIRQWFEERKQIIQKITDDFGLQLLAVYSNLFEFYDFPYKEFSYYFACTYGSCALVLQNLIGIYYQSSGVTLEEFNIKTDHDCAYFDLFNLKELSTESLVFYSTGIERTRLEKIEYISKFESVTKNLSVCAEEVSGKGHLRKKKLNCGRCSKCLRTIAELYVFDRVDAFEDVFQLEYFKKNTQKELARMCCLNEGEFYNEIIRKLKKRKKIKLGFYYWRILFALVWKLKKKLRNSSWIRKIYYYFRLDILLNGYRDEGKYTSFIKK